MVQGIRIVEKSLGLEKKKILSRESLKNHKKSFFASGNYYWLFGCLAGGYDGIVSFLGTRKFRNNHN